MKTDYDELKKWAAPNDSKFLCRRANDEEPDSNGPLARTAFEHDRDRIIHSRAFRRLMHKTQIFNSKTNDHIRNRLTHTMEVYQIARGIGKPLGLNDTLIEAIALGHDLGHTPFGHVGERTLNSILMDKEKCPEGGEGFKHNFQGLAILDYLETGKANWRGLNITLAVREGILKHTKCTIKPSENQNQSNDNELNFVKYSQLNFESIDLGKPSFTLEGQTVAIADEIAQYTHDLEDAYRQGVIHISDLEEMDMVKMVAKKHNIELRKCKSANDIRINLIYYMISDLITDVYNESVKNIMNAKIKPIFDDENTCINENIIKFSGDISEKVKRLERVKIDKIILSRDVAIEDAKAEYIIKQIFKAYYEHPRQMPAYILNRYSKQDELNDPQISIKN